MLITLRGALHFQGKNNRKKKKMFSMPCDLGRLPIKEKL